jgi:hypothetical protein
LGPSLGFVSLKLRILYETHEFIDPKMPSPDGSGILFLPFLGMKRYSGQQEIAPRKTSFGTCQYSQLKRLKSTNFR